MTDFDDETLPPEDATEAGEATLPSRPRPDSGAMPERIGHFRVVRRLGAGGMGVVYAAHDDELDRDVAIKLLHSPRDEAASAPAQARLLREAQAMARLNHPNVIQVYEAGTHESRVYVAMEFVAGDTLKGWLGREKHDWRRKLDVFLDAGRGLAAAHGAGLVHRDFKPDNVMVGDDGRVRVLDFGLARQADEVARETEMHETLGTLSASRDLERITMTGAVMGTPAYMAPEQHLGGEAGPAADQFAFCVALWESLYGRRPFRGETLAQLTYAVFHDPPAPTGSDHDAPAWVEPLLRRGLERDPQLRWPSMNALLEALRKDPSLARRRRLIAASFVGLTAVAAYGYWPSDAVEVCTGAAAELEPVWNDARRESIMNAFEATGLPFAGRAWSSVDPVLGEFAQAWIASHEDACESHHRGEQSGATLDLRMTCLDHRRQELDALLTVFEDADATVVEKSVRASRSLEPIAGCADVERLGARTAPPSDPAVAAEVEAIRAELAAVKATREAGHYARAHELAQPLLERAEATEYEPVVAEALFALGDALDWVGQAEASLEHLKRAAWLAHANGDDPLATRAGAAVVWGAGNTLKRFEVARDWIGWSHATLQRLGGDPRLESELRLNAGAALMMAGDYEAAIAEDLRAIELARGVDELRATLAGVNLANVYYTKGEFEHALAEYQKARAQLERVLGPEHPRTLMLGANVLGVLQDLDRHDEAIEDGRRILALQERVLGADHPDVASTLNNLANSLESSGRLDEAQAKHERALAILEAAGRAGTDLATPLQNLGRVQHKRGDVARARAHLERAIALLEADGGAQHSWLPWPLIALARVEASVGEADRARALFERAEAIATEQLSPEHELVAQAVAGLGELDLQQGDHARALQRLERAHDLFVDALGPEHLDVALALVDRGLARLAAGREDEGVADLSAAIERLPPAEESACDARRALAEYWADRDSDRAAEIVAPCAEPSK